jgi:hypothetical protein
MNRNNFLGISNFIWWMGIVEDRIDPLAAGRCRVRIMGWHSDNKSILPTNELPWAHPMNPVNSSHTFSSPLVGDWIVGFFMDGESAQFPIMMGVLPYIKE